MTSCTEVREALSARLDDELSPAEIGPLDQHLAGCDSCRDAERALRAVRTRVRALHASPAPAALRARISRLVDADTAPPARAAVRRSFALPFRAVLSRPAWAVGAVVLFVGVALSVVGVGRLAARPPLPVRLAVADHQRHLDRGEPYSIASHDAGVVAAYFRERVPDDRYAVVPAVESSLEGGRLCRICGEPAAHFSFVDEQSRPLSVFVVSDDAGSRWGKTVVRAGRTYEVMRCHGCWVASWEWDGVRCAVICPSSAEHVLGKAEHARSVISAPS